MKIQRLINIVDNRYRVTIAVYDTTQNERELMAQFGEPMIEVGGNIVGSASRPDEVPTAVDFNLPPEQRRLISDFPLIKYFDLGDDEGSDIKAKVYTDEIVNRITAAKSALLSNAGNFEGETITTI